MALGCFSGKEWAISVLESDTLKDPFVILHEFTITSGRLAMRSIWELRSVQMLLRRSTGQHTGIQQFTGREMINKKGGKSLLCAAVTKPGQR
jgi:hypothetical protein